MVTTHLRKPGEVRQLPVLHHPLGDSSVLAIEPDEDEALDERLGLAAVPDCPPQRPKWPQQQRESREDHGDQQDRERTQHRETGAGPDVGVRDRRGAHQGEKYPERCGG